MTIQSDDIIRGSFDDGFFRRLVENAQDVVYRFELGPTPHFSYVNPALKQMLGYTPEDLYADPELASTLIHTDDLRVLSERRATGDLDPTIVRLMHRDGHIVWVELVVTRVFDKSGNLLGVEGVARDVGPRLEAEEELRDSQARFRTIFEHAPMGVVLLNLDGHALARNPTARRLLGIGDSQATDLAFYDFTHPDDLAVETPLFHELTKGRRDRYQLEKRLVRIDSRILWVRSSVSLVRGEHGEPRYAVAILEDIHEHRLAEDALRESERRYRELTDSLPETVFEMEMSGRLTFANRASLQQFGVTQEEVSRGVNIFDYIAPEDHERVRSDIRNRIAGTRIGPSEYTAVRKDGTRFPCAVSSAPVLRDGSPVGLRGFLIDVTERRQAQEALRESEARFRRLSETSTTAVYRLELRPERRFSYVSPSVDQFLGYTPGEFYADPDLPLKLVHPEEMPRLRSLAGTNALEAGVTFRAVHKDGHTIWLAQRDLAIHDGDGNVIAREGMLRDLTEYKAMEEQLLRAQRLEAAGRVAGQVAHDFNNLLSPLMAFTELLKYELPPDHPGVSYCDDMLSAVRRMTEINYDLLALGRRGLTGSATLDLNRLVRRVVSEIADRPGTLTVQLETAADLPPVNGSEAQLSRVLANLIANAREAMHDDGQLTIATEDVRVDRSIDGYNRIEVGEYVRLTVADTGCGIAPEIRTRIFDAFFTTKCTDRNRGSGLGLSVVQAIVEDHHGYLDLETEVGKGTTFAVYLPVSENSVRPGQGNGPMGGTETLLVADDDPEQLKVSGELLRRLGYAVRTASSGEEALEKLAASPIDLLVLDIVMPPGIDGTETYRRALSLRPGLPAVFLSGYAESVQIVEAQKLGATAFVNKPVSLEKLAQAVRTQLDRR